jgi:hypothetical protein
MTVARLDLATRSRVEKIAHLQPRVETASFFEPTLNRPFGFAHRFPNREPLGGQERAG